MRVWKQPSDKRVFTYDFASFLGGATIAVILSATSESRTGSPATALVKESEATSDTAAQIGWSGGVDGVEYRTTVRVRDTANNEHELDGSIFVSDTKFVLPLGVTSTYLTGEEYVDRFGYEETVRLTDETRSGTIDGPAIMAALADASQLADSYVAVRYNLPLPIPVPEVLKQVVADLARERLHKTKPTPMVTANADRARSTLRDIAGGRATLVLDTGAEVESPPETLPQWAQNDDATVFNSDKLAGF